MSHNSIKIAGKEPAAAGEITLVTSDLSDVQGTPTAGQALQWDGAAWVPVTTSATPAYSYALFGRGEADDYSNLGITPTAGNLWGFYDTAPFNSIAGSVTFNTTAGWLTSITLAAGKYILTAGTGCVFSSTGYLALTTRQTANFSVFYGATASIGANVTAYGAASGVIHASIEVTNATDIGIYITAASGLSSTQGNTPAEQGFILIQKVS